MSNLLKNFVGIDISKRTFDAALLRPDQPNQIVHQQFKQDAQGFGQFQSWLKQLDVTINEQTLFCMEFTGLYATRLIEFLCQYHAQLWVEHALKIKRADAFSRAANDKTDAIKIAQYAYRFQDRKTLWSPTDRTLEQLKQLLAQRDRIILALTQLMVPVTELKEVGSLQEAKKMEQLQQPAIKNLQKTKDNIEKAINQLVKKNEQMAEKVARVKTIKGIGDVTAVAFLVYTHGFTSFQNAKQLACYCGVVPFVKKESGTAVKSKPQVSPLANKKLKKLLHLCALTAILHDPELKSYYERKVDQGKNKMSVINAVRNKLVLRMFAVVRDQRDFVEKHAA
jgi:transposase